MKIILLSSILIIIYPTIEILLDGRESTLNPLEDEFVINKLSYQQKNCLMIRNIFAGLPTYAPVDSGFFSSFKKPVSGQNKSFREIALRIIEQYDFDPADEDDRAGIQSHIQELRATKKEYFDRFQNGTALNLEKEIYETEKYSAKLSNLTAYLKELNTKNEQLISQFEMKLGELKSLVSQEDGEMGQIKSCFKEIQFLNGVSSNLSMVAFDVTILNQVKDQLQTSEFIDSIDSKFLQKLDQNFKRGQEQMALKDLKQAVKMVAEMKKHESANSNVKQETKHFEKIEKKLGKLEKQIEKDNKDISNFLNKKVQQATQKIKKNSVYKKYATMVGETLKLNQILTKSKQQYRVVKQEFKEYSSKKQQVEIKVEGSFTISKSTKEALKTNIDFLENKSQIYFEEDLESKNLFSDDKEFLKLFNMYKQTYQNQQEKVQEQLEMMKEKQRLILIINEKEQIVDQVLGKMFGRTQIFGDSVKCFTRARLSYIFFSLVKINVIIKEKHFLRSYLQELDYLIAKDFIVYNYQIFSQNSFIETQNKMDDFNYGLAQKMEKDRENLFENYIKNWAFFMMAYKEFTIFGTGDQNHDARQMRLGRRFMTVVGLSFKKIVLILKKTSVSLLMVEIWGEIIGMIPFIGSIPFLKDVLKTILAYMITLVIGIVMEQFKDKSFEQLPKVSQGFQKIFAALKKKPLYQLNYREYINEDQDLPEDAPTKATIDEDIRKLDHLYFDNMVKTEANDKNLNKNRIYDPRNNTLDIARIKNQIIFQDVQNAVQSGLVSAADAHKFEQQKGKIRLVQDEIRQISNASRELKSLVGKKIKSILKTPLLVV